MFKIDLLNETLEEVAETSLVEASLEERGHLQQWIRHNPDIISRHFETELKIISEEFDEFETNDRLDLLALDNEGNLVVIELKRKDSGSRIDIQGLKYASYCSTLKPLRIVEIYQKYLKKNNIEINARDDIADFLSGGDGSGEEEINNMNSSQRIILCAQSFDSRVKSVVAWLGEQDIDISCIEFNVFKDESTNTLFMDSKVILPLQSIDDFFVKDSSLVENKGKKSKKLVPQPEEVLTFLNEFKATIKESYGHHARGMPHVKYRTFKSGRSGLSFAFEVMKKQKQYKINILARKPEIKLLEAFEKLRNKIQAPNKLEFVLLDPEKDEGTWQRVMVFYKPAAEYYLRDVEVAARLMHEFITNFKPITDNLKK